MPGIAEVLAGQWEQHSAFFYRHRVEEMKAHLATHPDDWDAMDNLAVAQAKLGDTDAGIAVMFDKEKRHPGQYTTASNLGTFYMFKNDLPHAIDWLKKALAINPNAHFGREEYQLQLAQFLQRTNAHPEVRADDFLDLRKFRYRNEDGSLDKPPEDSYDTNDSFLMVGRPEHFDDFHMKPNVFDGVVGMIRFGTTQSADLYFALGDLLAAHGQRILAYRAFQRALELHYPVPDVVKESMNRVREVEVPQEAFEPSVINQERAAAARWVADYQAFENNLIRAGKSTDDEANYAPFYATHPRSLATKDFFVADIIPIYGKELSVAGVVAGIFTYFAWRYRPRSRSPMTRPQVSPNVVD